MNKPSWLSLINFFILLFVLCSYFGIINPQNWINDIHNKSGIEVITPIQALDKKVTELERAVKDSNVFWGNEYHNLVTKEEFNRYQHLSKDSVDWIVNSIKNLQSNTNISKEIVYWKSEYQRNSCSYSNYVNGDVCKNINMHLFNLEQKLSK